MAEALGLVASGISVAQLAGNITTSVIKLKDYWEQVRDAPAEIGYLVREIDSFGLILSHIQNDQKRQPLFDNACVQQSLRLCTEGADELSALVNELSNTIGGGRSGWRRKVGAAKVVLKKEEIKKLKRRMKHAMQLLSLAYNYHTRWV
jgi:hypothetical protein